MAELGVASHETRRLLKSPAVGGQVSLFCFCLGPMVALSVLRRICVPLGSCYTLLRYNRVVLVAMVVTVLMALVEGLSTVGGYIVGSRVAGLAFLISSGGCHG